MGAADLPADFDSLPAWKRLGILLDRAGARVTLDRKRDFTLPCIACGETERPRDLLTVGRWAVSPGGGHVPGDRIERPVCGACAPLFPRGGR